MSQPAGQLSDNLHFLCLVKKRLGALTHRNLIRQPYAGVSQILSALAELAQVRDNTANDSSLLTIRKRRQRQAYRNFRLRRPKPDVMTMRPPFTLRSRSWK